MSTSHPGLRVRAACVAYRWALLRYPRAVRARWGPRMVADFQALLAEEVARAGWRGWWVGCVRGFGDLLRPLPGAVGPTGAKRPAASSLLDDFRAAARAVARRPGFTAMVVGVLGLGIALNTSVFALVDAYLIRPFPYPDVGRLVEIRPPTAAVGWRNSGDLFERSVAWDLGVFTLVGDGDPEIAFGAHVTPDFFDLYGVHPVLGRGFDDADGGAPVALISHALWTSRFGADPSVIGRSFSAYSSEERGGRERYTIIGVLPGDFWYFNRYVDVLVPLGEAGPVSVARLRSDVPLERAEEVVNERARAALGPGDAETHVSLTPIQEAYSARIRPRLVTLQGASLLVLLIACLNGGLLVLVRANGRVRELGVRRALGAGRGRLARQLLVEGLILSGLAGLLGLVGGRWALAPLARAVTGLLGLGIPGGAEALRFHVAAFGAATAVVAGVGVLFGLVPLWITGRQDPARLMGGSARGNTEPAGASRVRWGLVAAEVALSFTLLTGGALMVRSALHLSRVELGFDPDGLEAFSLGVTETGPGATDPLAFFRRLVARIEALPSVVGVGLSRAAPFGGELTGRDVEADAVDGGGTLSDVVPQIASPGYFDVVGLDVVRGRNFGPEDEEGALQVAVVDEALAARLWPDGRAVGRRLHFPAWTMSTMSEDPGPWLTVIGVVPDLVDGLEGARPTVYVPFAQSRSTWMDVVVRRRPGSPGVGPEFRRVLRDLDPEVPVYSVDDIPASVARARAPSRFFAGLLGAFSAFSLLLAVVGLYGVAAYATRRRHRDLAVRLALGATRGAVERMFVAEAAVAVGIGLAAGGLGAHALAEALAGQLHGVRPDDPTTLLVSAGLLAVTALLAAWLPARRAARLDVSTVLREE